MPARARPARGSSARGRRAGRALRARRGTPGGRAAARGARPLARGAARGSRGRGVRARRSDAARGAPPRGLEQRIDADLALGRHAELVGELEAARGRAPAPRAPPRAADARALPIGAAGRGARRLPRRARRAGRRARHRARAAAAAARAGDPRPGPVARLAAASHDGAEAAESDRAVAAAVGRCARRTARRSRSRSRAGAGGGASSPHGSCRDEDDVASGSRCADAARAERSGPHVADRRLHDAATGRRRRPPCDGIRRRLRARSTAPPRLDGTQLSAAARRLLAAHPPTSASSRARVPTGSAACSCRSAAASTSGPRSSSGRGDGAARRVLQLTLVGTKADARRGPARREPPSRRRVACACNGSSGRRSARPGRRAERALVEAVGRRRLVVAGVSPRWRQEGIGDWRRALVSGGRLPVCCSSTVGRARGCSLRVRAARASRGRSRARRSCRARRGRRPRYPAGTPCSRPWARSIPSKKFRKHGERRCPEQVVRAAVRVGRAVPRSSAGARSNAELGRAGWVQSHARAPNPAVSLKDGYEERLGSGPG